jgi:CRP/FNR family transcriptional regulator, cyclic AMP receptor protein
LATGEQSPSWGSRGSAPGSVASLLAVLPEFAAVVPATERGVAERVLLGPVLSAHDADLADLLTSRASDAFDFLILDGVVFKETTLLGRSALELLGPGDVVAPPLTAVRQVESRAVSRYVAHGDVSLTPLDDRFRRATRRWPGLADVLHDRLGQQTHRASMHLAMLHLPRVEDRVIALFADLGERLGHMTTDGIVISIGLTHDAIGRLVGSRRPTVSLALQALADDGRLERLEGDRWRLAPSAIAP